MRFLENGFRQLGKIVEVAAAFHISVGDQTGNHDTGEQGQGNKASICVVAKPLIGPETEYNNIRSQ